MPKRVAGVSARLLECAKEEFLEKGFQNASIREIAQKADTSPRALYTRFPNKEGLFDAIITPTSEGIVKLYQDFAAQFWMENKAKQEVPQFVCDPIGIYSEMLDYIYDHADECKLMLHCLDGTRYTALIEKLSQVNFGYLQEFSELHRANFTDFEIMMTVFRMLTRTFYSAMFEPLRCNMNREDAHFYMRKLCDFFVSGIQGLRLV